MSFAVNARKFAVAHVVLRGPGQAWSKNDGSKTNRTSSSRTDVAVHGLRTRTQDDANGTRNERVHDRPRGSPGDLGLEGRGAHHDGARTTRRPGQRPDDWRYRGGRQDAAPALDRNRQASGAAR